MGWPLWIHFGGGRRLDADQYVVDLLGLGAEECGCKVWRQGTDECLDRVSVELGFCNAKAPWQNVVARYSCVCNFQGIVGMSAKIMRSDSLQRYCDVAYAANTPIGNRSKILTSQHCANIVYAHV